jgi:putative radical SAM enzyme (TIGR03279 family)
MKISLIKNKNLASLINPGDELVEINREPINDFLDFKFHSAEKHLALKIRDAAGIFKKINVRKKVDEDLGMFFEEEKYKSCGNNCIFCFVHQLPKGLRKTLYFKDEDYRLSFLFGNYLTLTNLVEEDFKRIFKYRLSPLYISVQSTNEPIRKMMLGNQKIPDIFPLLQRLAQQKIEMHTQIVICPGINDGKILENSIKDLAGLFPYVKSLAIVPVGLSKHRRNLFEISPVAKSKARELIFLINHCRELLMEGIKDNFVYAADELYLKAGLKIPKVSYYDDFPQIENGVGMVRKFLDDFKKNQKTLPKKLTRKLEIILVTAKSAETFLRKDIVPTLEQIENLKIEILCVENKLLGKTITVTGLLAGSDILNACKKRKDKKTGKVVILPPNCLNNEGLFLDDLTPEDLEEELAIKVILGKDNFLKTLKDVFKKFA